MKIHRFYIPVLNLKAGEVNKIQDERVSFQCRNVLKLKKGEMVELFDGTGSEYLSEIDNVDRHSIFVRLTEKREPKTRERKEVLLFLSTIKKDNFELAVEKCTEIGITGFVPVVSERSDKKELNMERLNRISIEASEQSGKVFIPQIHEPTPLKEIFKKYEDLVFIAFEPRGEQIYDKKSMIGKLGIFIGPEGGYTDNDLKIFKDNNVPVVSMGDTILRAETAAIVASAKILL